MSEIADKIVKPTVEMLDHMARKIPEALGKAHYRISKMAHDAADHFDKVEEDVAGKARIHTHGGDEHLPGGGGGLAADADRAAAAAGKDGERAAADAERDAEREAASEAEHGLRPHDGNKESVPGSEKECETDPIDVATGDMLLPIVDVQLAGVLPLILERTHISSYRHGLWFGPSWASTLDQRLQLDSGGVVFASADGMRLEYPPPRADAEVLPLKGPRRPLGWSGTPNDPMRVGDPVTGETLVFDHPRPAPGVVGGVILRLTAIEDRNGNRIDIDYADDDTPALISHHSGYRIAVDRHSELRRITGFRLLDTDGPGTETDLVRFGYDDVGDLTEVFNSSGEPLRLSYDDRHRITGWSDRNGTEYGYVYDHAGRVVRTTGSGGCMSSTFAYDDATRTTTFTNSLGHVTTHKHNEAYRLIRTTDPLGNVTVQEWDENNRLLTGVIDPLDRTTRYIYDEADNLTAVLYPDGSAEETNYNELGLPLRITEAGGQIWRNEYDELGNRLASIDPLGARTEYTYDASGHLTSVTDALGGRHRLTNDAAGLPVAVTDPLANTVRCTRDAFGRVVTLVEPLGGTTRRTWSIEGKPLSHTLPDGTTETWEWDGEGNLISHRDAIGGITSFETTHFDLTSARTTPDGARIEFAYDTELRLTTVTNPQGLTWTYDYDAAGHLISETDFSDCTLSYTYDAAGQLTSRTNALDQTTRYSRDLLGNITEQRSPDGLTSLTYDSAGLLLRATNGDADLTFTRDLLGRVLTETCNGSALTNTYDALGRRTRRRTPSGVVSEWSWDANGQPEALETAGHILRFTHDAIGRQTEQAIGADIRLTQEWDQAHRPTGQTLTLATASGGSPSGRPDHDGGSARHLLRQRTYTYRADGNLTSIHDSATGTRRFTLDRMGRVTAVTGSNWSETYAYDTAGNLTQAATPASPDSDGPRATERGVIHRAGRVRYEYDAQGRMVLRQTTRLSRKPDTWRYVWDVDDRLTAVTTPDGQLWRYLHDALGRRIAKQRLAADGETVLEEVLFTWDGPHLAEQTSRTPGDSESLTLTWDRDGVRPLTQTERTSLVDAPQNEVDQRFFAIVTDLIGTPTELVSEAGDIAWSAHSTLWGVTAGDYDTAASTPLRFPGQYFDPETQLHYNYFRHYDPTTALYASPDPLGLEAGPNPRAYVLNPLAWLDYLGLLTCRQNARRLRRNMRLAGRPVGRGQAAAHIVPSGGSGGHWVPGARSRALLQRYGVDINDEANGIPLGHPSPHNFTHREPFLRRVNQRLDNLVQDRVARGYGRGAIRADLRRELRRIGREVEGELATGTPGPGAVWTAP